MAESEEKEECSTSPQMTQKPEQMNRTEGISLCSLVQMKNLMKGAESNAAFDLKSTLPESSVQRSPEWNMRLVLVSSSSRAPFLMQVGS